MRTLNNRFASVKREGAYNDMYSQSLVYPGSDEAEFKPLLTSGRRMVKRDRKYTTLRASTNGIVVGTLPPRTGFGVVRDRRFHNITFVRFGTLNNPNLIG